MSYAATTVVTNTITTNAQFRTWGLIYAAKFASMGWVQSAEAGQIDWAAVATPGVINTVAGYEIWHFNDALQATVPIFLKIEYGAGAAVANGSLWITVGTGSTGIGGLTGIVSTRQQVQCTATAGAISHYWSGDTNRGTIAVVGAAAATSMHLGIERTVDNVGALTGEGILLVYRGTSAWGQQAWNYATGPYTATWELSLGCMGAAVAPFGVTGLQVAVYPVYHNKGVFCNPGYNCMMYENAVVGALATISFNVYGAAHTYVTLGSTCFGSGGRGGFTTAALMMRYE